MKDLIYNIVLFILVLVAALLISAKVFGWYALL